MRYEPTPEQLPKKRPKTETRTRCPGCGQRTNVFPIDCEVCLECKVERIAQEGQQRTQRYLAEVPPVESLGAITSRRSKPR